MPRPEHHKELRRKLRQDATFPERLLWSVLRNKQTGYKFRRQESIGRYIVVFICYEKNLIVEVVGIHHCTEEMEKYDEVRDKFLESQGFTVMHFSDQEIRENLDGAFWDIKCFCDGIRE